MKKQSIQILLWIALALNTAAADVAPPFSITHQESRWSLVAPDGKPFFSLGVDCVNQGLTRAEFDTENPGYAAWQHYAEPSQWADATLRRLKSWGFTTVGAWSDHATLRASKEQTLWLTPVLHLGSTAGVPWWDMWDAKIIRRMDDVAREQILAVRDDPRLIGYFSDNELGWWNATLWKMTLEQAPSSGQRQRLIQLLRDTYQNDWNKLLRDFEPENAGSWSTLRRRGTLFLKPGSEGIKTMRRFLGLLADRYYQLTHDIIRKYDQRALILGDRYQSFYYPEVAQAAARYVDAISSNLNASWNDGTFLRSYLDTLHALTGKPIIISEIYLAAAENRSNNRNNQGVYPVVASQAQRAAATRNTLIALAKLPYVIGVDWFQYSDEPRHGRADGENFNFGLVDIDDRPYEEVTAAFASLNLTQLREQPALTRTDASGGVPRALSNPLEDFEATRALKRWDRERGFVKPASEFPLADLYVCWTPQAVFLGLYGFDFTEDTYYRSRSISKNDRSQWIVQPADLEPVRARLGAGREPIVSDADVRVHNLSGLNLNVRSVAIMELPARRFARDEFKPGDSIEFTSTLFTHGQAYKMEWNGKFELKE